MKPLFLITSFGISELVVFAGVILGLIFVVRGLRTTPNRGMFLLKCAAVFVGAFWLFTKVGSTDSGNLSASESGQTNGYEKSASQRMQEERAMSGAVDKIVKEKGLCMACSGSGRMDNGEGGKTMCDVCSGSGKSSQYQMDKAQQQVDNFNNKIERELKENGR